MPSIHERFAAAQQRHYFAAHPEEYHALHSLLDLTAHSYGASLGETEPPHSVIWVHDEADNYDFLASDANAWQPTVPTLQTTMKASPHLNSREQSTAGRSVAQSAGIDFKNSLRFQAPYMEAKKELGMDADAVPRAVAVTIFGKHDVNKQRITTSPYDLLTNERERHVISDTSLTLMNAAVETDTSRKQELREHATEVARQQGLVACTKLVDVRWAGPIKHLWASRFGWMPAEAAADTAMLTTGAVAWNVDASIPLRYGPFAAAVPLTGKLVWDIWQFRKREPLLVYKHVGVTVFNRIQAD